MNAILRLARTFSVRLVLILACVFAFAAAAHAADPPIPAQHVRIHYFNPDNTYAGWTVYAFGDTTEDQSNFNGGPVQVTGIDDFGAYFDVGVTATAQDVGIIIHMGNLKDPGPDEHIDPATQGNEYWQISGQLGLKTTRPAIPVATALRFPQDTHAFTTTARMAISPAGPSTPSSPPVIQRARFVAQKITYPALTATVPTTMSASTPPSMAASLASSFTTAPRM